MVFRKPSQTLQVFFFISCDGFLETTFLSWFSKNQKISYCRKYLYTRASKREIQLSKNLWRAISQNENIGASTANFGRCDGFYTASLKSDLLIRLLHLILYLLNSDASLNCVLTVQKWETTRLILNVSYLLFSISHATTNITKLVPLGFWYMLLQ